MFRFFSKEKNYLPREMGADGACLFVMLFGCAIGSCKIDDLEMELFPVFLGKDFF